MGFDIGTEIIKAVQSNILERGGGHKMAGGFTIKEKNIPIFRDLLIERFEKSYANSSKDINLYLDSVIAPSALNVKFFEEINREGTAILMASHNYNLIKGRGHRIIEIRNGSIRRS